MMSITDFAYVFKIMSDETRLKIIKMLSQEKLCACHILEEFEITQPTLSYHMKLLVESGLVNNVKEGNLTRYSLDKDKIKELSTFFVDIETKETVARDATNCSLKDGEWKD